MRLNTIHKPVVLVIMDGWGIAPPSEGNAVSLARTPNFTSYQATYPYTQLRASGEWVGLPRGEPGNSEVGHLNMGAGRIVYQDLPRINMSIADGSFLSNKAFLDCFDHVRKNSSKIHLIGLVGLGGVHSSLEHLYALLWLCKEKNMAPDQVVLHLFTDGRDSPPNSAPLYLSEIEYHMKEIGVGVIASLIGRYYPMDRDKRWERIEKSYDLLTAGIGTKENSVLEAVEHSYQNGKSDEFILPCLIEPTFSPIKDNDAVIFFNFRPDRGRQLTKAFISPGFDKFERKAHPKHLFFVTMTEYEKDLPAEIAFPPTSARDTLGDVLAKNNLKQLRISETEKYAHVTYFFNGGREEKSPGEDHVLVPSPQVASYDLTPEMSAIKITDQLIAFIKQDIYDFILVNFANADMVGHTGNIKAAVKAIETVDKCLKRLAEIVLDKNGVLMVTADHGNAENMFNMQTGEIDKEHTADPVPFILVGKQFEGKTIGFRDTPGSDLSLLKPQGILSDVAPTILKILDLKKPPEMTGRSLL